MNPIIIHLANLKFYANFKKSKANSFDQYVRFIDTGSPEDFRWSEVEGITVIDKYEFDDPFLGDVIDSKTEEVIEQYLEQKRKEHREPQLDIGDWYENTLIEIEFKLKQHSAELPINRNPFKVLREVLDGFNNLKRLISINEEDFYTYTSHMQGRAPEDFFDIFSESDKQIQNYPLINCYPRVFIDCKAYEFFDQLTENIENPAADFSFIFYKMRNDKLIHYHCKEEYQEIVNKYSSSFIEIYSENKTKKSAFRSKYNRLHELMY